MPSLRTLVMLFVMLPWCARIAAASPLRIDLDHDGIRDIVRIAQPPARPGLELWLSTTQRVMRVKARMAINAVVAADVDQDGWPDLVASGSGRSQAGLHIWKNAGRGNFEPVKRRRHARRGRLSRHTGGRVADFPDEPPSSVATRILSDVGTPPELSYFPLHLTPTVCAIPVQCVAPHSSHALPRTPRAPPATQSL